MIAFEVEPYIAKAIESVLAQRSSFPYELIIGEDCSTDGTRAIVEDYARRYPDIVRPICRTTNLGMNRNFFATYAEARGTYIALLDADDYWTAMDKLATQVAYLERHPGCALCFHNVTVEYDDGTPTHPFHMAQPVPRLSARVPRVQSGAQQLSGGNFIQTASVMYRAHLVRGIPEWVSEMPTFDWPLHLLHAEQGTVDYLDRTMAAYRVHEGGMWSSGLSYYRTTGEIDSMIRAFDLVAAHFRGQYGASAMAPLAFLRERGLTVALRSRDFVAAGRYAPHVAAHALREGHVPGAVRACLALILARLAALWARRTTPRDTAAPGARDAH